MRCGAVRRRLSAYSDGALALSQVVAVKEHLAGCPACRRELSALRRLNRMLAERGARTAAGPDLNWPAFERRLATRLAAEGLDFGERAWLWRRATVRGAVLAAAAVLLLVGAAVFLDAAVRPAGVVPLPPAGSVPLPVLPGDSTLRYDGLPRFHVETLVHPWPQPEAAPSTAHPPAGGADGPLRLAWLAGTDGAWTGTAESGVTVRVDDPRGGAQRYSYAFAAPRP